MDDGFYGKPIILETEPDQEFLGFMLETKPLELIYQGPTNISQVLSPFSASPPTVLLSGFRSRCHIVIKGAFPTHRVQQGLSQLIRLYTRAGFPNEELQAISNQLLIQHQNSTVGDQICRCSLLIFSFLLLLCLPGYSSVLPVLSSFGFVSFVCCVFPPSGLFVGSPSVACCVLLSCFLSFFPASWLNHRFQFAPPRVLPHGSCSRS